MRTRAGNLSSPPSSGTKPSDEEVRYALLSVYYATLGQRFSISGAPSVLLPAEATSETLAGALETLSRDSQGALNEGLWLIVRNTPLRRSSRGRSPYPPEVEPYFSKGRQVELDELRREYRSGTNLFAAALVACRDQDWPQFQAILEVLTRDEVTDRMGFASVTELMFGQPPRQYLASMVGAVNRGSGEQQWKRASKQIARLEDEVGLSIYDFVEDLASAVAFQKFVVETDDADGDHPLTVFPVSSRIFQDTDELWTSATVTTLAKGDFETFCRVTEPSLWSRSSDVITKSSYVEDPFSLVPAPPSTAPLDNGEDRLLYEEAAISWGRDQSRQSVFRNVLNVARSVRAGPADAESSIDIVFSLCRSVSSDVLWDRRSGGIMMNQGFMKVRPMGGDTWRITSRKVLRFSDRTPYAGASGGVDFGQLLNYLAPAALSWWVETETYSLGDKPGGPPPSTSENGSEHGQRLHS
ncbi:MAG: hypothetical protein L0H41_08180 [Microlunatus sp.]|nr:hypothetical protein [Microlunatus sp.]